MELIRALRPHPPLPAPTIQPQPLVQPTQARRLLPLAMAEARTGVDVVDMVDADEVDVDADPSRRAMIDLHSH